jgi:hypothetical protein
MGYARTINQIPDSSSPTDVRAIHFLDGANRYQALPVFLFIDGEVEKNRGMNSFTFPIGRRE